MFYPNDEIGRVNYTNLHVTLVYYLKERSWTQSNFVMGLRKLGATTEYYYNDELYDFSKPVTSDMKLEARWVEIGKVSGITLNNTKLSLYFIVNN